MIDPAFEFEPHGKELSVDTVVIRLSSPWHCGLVEVIKRGRWHVHGNVTVSSMKRLFLWVYMHNGTFSPLPYNGHEESITTDMGWRLDALMVIQRERKGSE